MQDFVMAKAAFPHNFSVVTVNCNSKGRIQINFSGIVYLYISTPIGKPFLVSIIAPLVYLRFASFQLTSSVMSFSSYPFHNGLDACLTWLCGIIKLWRWEGKGCRDARDVDFTCWCHLSNSSPGSIFNKRSTG